MPLSAREAEATDTFASFATVVIVGVGSRDRGVAEKVY
jgi:hypothetical protein